MTLLTGCCRGDGQLFEAHPDDRQRAITTWDRATAERKPYVLEFRVPVADGSCRDFEVRAVPILGGDGEIREWIGLCKDISERRRSEAALCKSESAFRRLFEKMPAGTYTCDAKGLITSFNQRAVELWGREPKLNDPDDRFCGAVRLFTPDGTPLPHERCWMARALQDQQEYNGRELVIERPDGSRRFSLAHANPLYDDSGKLIGAQNILLDITEHKRAQQSLHEIRDRLATLSRQLIGVQEAERRHLARELHDEIGQVLCAISVNLKIVKTQVDDSAWPRLEESIQIIDGAVDQVRNLSLDLRPPILDDFGLAAALRWYVDRLSARTGLCVHLTTESRAAAIPVDVRNTCFRAAQEALTNVVRHASAQEVWIGLVQRESEILLTIRDDGIGFDPKAAPGTASNGHHMGLLGMHERVELLDGKTHLQSAPGKGTTVQIRLPLTGPASPAADRSA